MGEPGDLDVITAYKELVARLQQQQCGEQEREEIVAELRSIFVHDLFASVQSIDEQEHLQRELRNLLQICQVGLSHAKAVFDITPDDCVPVKFLQVVLPQLSLLGVSSPDLRPACAVITRFTTRIIQQAAALPPQFGLSAAYLSDVVAAICDCSFAVVSSDHSTPDPRCAPGLHLFPTSIALHCTLTSASWLGSGPVQGPDELRSPQPALCQFPLTAESAYAQLGWLVTPLQCLQHLAPRAILADLDAVLVALGSAALAVPPFALEHVFGTVSALLTTLPSGLHTVAQPHLTRLARSALGGVFRASEQPMHDAEVAISSADLVNGNMLAAAAKALAAVLTLSHDLDASDCSDVLESSMDACVDGLRCCAAELDLLSRLDALSPTGSRQLSRLVARVSSAWRAARRELLALARVLLPQSTRGVEGLLEVLARLSEAARTALTAMDSHSYWAADVTAFGTDATSWLPESRQEPEARSAKRGRVVDNDRGQDSRDMSQDMRHALEKHTPCHLQVPLETTTEALVDLLDCAHCVADTVVETNTILLLCCDVLKVCNYALQLIKPDGEGNDRLLVPRVRSVAAAVVCRALLQLLRDSAPRDKRCYVRPFVACLCDYLTCDLHRLLARPLPVEADFALDQVQSLCAFYVLSTAHAVALAALGRTFTAGADRQLFGRWSAELNVSAGDPLQVLSLGFDLTRAEQESGLQWLLHLASLHLVSSAALHAARHADGGAAEAAVEALRSVCPSQDGPPTSRGAAFAEVCFSAVAIASSGPQHDAVLLPVLLATEAMRCVQLGRKLHDTPVKAVLSRATVERLAVGLCASPVTGATTDLGWRVAELLVAAQPWTKSASLTVHEMMCYAAAVCLGFRKQGPAVHEMTARFASRSDDPEGTLRLLCSVTALQSRLPARTQGFSAGELQAVDRLREFAAENGSANQHRWRTAALLSLAHLLGPERSDKVVWLLLERLNKGNVDGEAAAAAALQALAAAWGESLCNLVLSRHSVLCSAALEASPSNFVLSELPLLSPEISTKALAVALLEHAVGDMCLQHRLPALQACGELLQVTPGLLVQRHIPFIAAHCLWASAPGEEGIDAATLEFLDSVLQQGPGSTADDELRKHLWTIRFEVVYQAAAPDRWPDTGFPSAALIEACRVRLRSTTCWQEGTSELLAHEYVEGFVGTFGEALKGATTEAASRLAPARLARAANEFQATRCELSASWPREPLQALRATILLTCLLGPMIEAHTLKMMVVLAAGLDEHFAGHPVRLQAIRGLQCLVKRLAEKAPAMLPQVSAHVVSQVLPVLQGDDNDNEAAAAGTADPATIGADSSARRESACNESRRERDQGAVAELLSELIVRQGAVLGQEGIRALPGLPSACKHPRIVQLRRDYLEPAQTTIELPQRMSLLIGSLQDQAMPVRYAALCNLSRLLAKDAEGVRSLTLHRSGSPSNGTSKTSSRSRTAIARLVAALLKVCDLARADDCRMNDATHLRLATCLGQLGALDPARVSLIQPPLEPLHESPRPLMTAVLTHIARVMRTMSHLEAANLCMYAMHKLLELAPQHGVDMDGQEGVLSELSRADRELVELQRGVATSARSSEFVIPAPGRILLPRGPPVTCYKWLDRWIRQLLTRCPKGPVTTILALASYTQAQDMSMLLFILPHAMYGAVTAPQSSTPHFVKAKYVYGSKEARLEVLREIAAVVRACCSNQQHCSDASGKAPADGASGGQPPWAAPHFQAIVAALDRLHSWRCAAEDSLAAARNSYSANAAVRSRTKRPAEQQAQLQLLESRIQYWEERIASVKLLQSALCKPPAPPSADGPSPYVTMDQIAHAAHCCGADARALRLLEMWLRHQSKMPNVSRGPAHSLQPLADTEVTMLMHIFKGLQDPDSLSSLGKLRTNPDPQDWVLCAQALGRWDEACSLLERQAAPASCSAATSALNGTSLHPSGSTAAQPPEASFAAAQHALTMQPGIQASRIAPGIAEQYYYSLLASGKPRVVLSMAEGAVAAALGAAAGLNAQAGALSVHAAAAGIGACWRLAEWDAMARFLQVLDASNNSVLSDVQRWEVTLGRALLLFHSGDLAAANAVINAERRALATQLALAGLESYERAYPMLVKLHMLWDLHEIGGMRVPDASTDTIRSALATAMERIEKTTAPQVLTRTNMLGLVRSLATLHDLPDFAAATWSRHVAICRAMRHSDAAWYGVLEAERGGERGAFKEKAKLLFDAARYPEAFEVMQRGLAKLEASTDGGDRKVAARAQLKLLAWKAEQGHGDESELTQAFRKLTAARPHDDKALMDYALFLDKIYSDLRTRQLDADTKQENMQHSDLSRSRLVFLNYAPSLVGQYSLVITHGRKRAFHALPRMLTLVNEFGCDVLRVEKMRVAKRAEEEREQKRGISKGSAAVIVDPVEAKRQARLKAMAALLIEHLPNAIKKMDATLKDAQKQMQPEKLLQAMTQASAYLAHDQPTVRAFIQRCLAEVLIALPQHASWLLVATQNTENVARKAATRVVVDHVKARQGANSPAYTALRLCDNLATQLVSLAQLRHGKNTKLSLKVLAPNLASAQDAGILVPRLQSFNDSYNGIMQGTPSDGLDSLVTVSCFLDEVAVMASLNMPKTVEMRGSDGHVYKFLAKHNDDVRRDMRVMEYATLLNRLLADDGETRQRELQMRTFMCCPLRDNGGLVEWVPNTTPVMVALSTCYARNGISRDKWSPGGLRERWQSIYDACYKPPRNEGPGPLRKWLTAMYKQLPPVIHEWWLKHKPDPASWLEARLTFTRSAATWSIAGHVVGLGDRHSENILIDLSSGAMVHIDFGILFDQGLNLPVPEVVPFRMTQNLVDSFGVCGLDGGFRQGCCAALGVMRANTRVIIGLLQAIADDPFVDWVAAASRKGGASKNRNATLTGAVDIAWVALASCNGKFQGVLAGARKRQCRQMSVTAHVDFLIQEATNIDNLARMYAGWCPWF